MERENSLGGTDIELTDREAITPWFGFSRAEAMALPDQASPNDRTPVTVQTVAQDRWNADHIQRLLATGPASDRETDGLVPVVRVTQAGPEDLEVVSLRTDAPRFQERLDFRTPPSWNEGAGVALTSAEVVERGHSLGLRHGALGASDVIVAGNELAVAGMGLSLAGTPEASLDMAPEVSTSGLATVPGDVYSLGRLLAAGTAGDDSTPDEITALIADATADNPNERIQSARIFADRLRDAGGESIRTYVPMSFAGSPMVGNAAVAASATGAGTVAAATAAGTAGAATTAAGTATTGAAAAGAATAGGGKVLPWLVGAGLAGVIGFGLWAAVSGSDSADDDGGGAFQSTVSSITTTSTTDPNGVAEGEGDDGDDDNAAETDPGTTTVTTAPTTTSTTTSPTTTLPEPVDVPAVAEADAGFEVVHGLTEPDVDAYLDGELLVGDFNPGEIAGPVGLDTGVYDLALYPQVDSPPESAADREDEPLFERPISVEGGPETLVVGTDADGGIDLTNFGEDLTDVAAGEGRLSIRNPTTNSIVVTIDPNPFMDGDAIERQAIAPGGVFTRDLPAGDYRLFVAEENGSSLLATVVSNTEGEVTTGTFLHNGESRLILQRVGDLGTPPVGIPTGDSGLLPTPNDPFDGLLIAAAGAFGLFALVGRMRFRSASD